MTGTISEYIRQHIRAPLANLVWCNHINRKNNLMSQKVDINDVCRCNDV